MNENILSFIKWAAGIVITLAIISIAVLVFTKARDATVSSIGKMDDINKTVSESDLMMYEGVTVSGSEVVNCIRKYEDNYMGIQVNTGNGSSVWYGYSCSISGTPSIGSATSSSVSRAIDETSASYINPNGKFMGKTYRDANGLIIAITFTQK